MALQTLRAHSKGWVAGILFFFLIVAFAAWGIEDMLRQGFSRTGPVITVGSETVLPREFENAYQRMIRNLQERLNRQFDYDTAKTMGFIDALVAELQSERMFAQKSGARNCSPRKPGGNTPKTSHGWLFMPSDCPKTRGSA